MTGVIFQTRAAEAEAWLAGYLVARGGRVDYVDIVAAAAPRGYGVKLLQRARLRAGVRTENIPGALPRRTSWVLDGVAAPTAP